MNFAIRLMHCSMYIARLWSSGILHRSEFSFFFCEIRNLAVNAPATGCAGIIVANTARLDSDCLVSARLDSTRFISVSWLTGRCPAAGAHDAPFITECSRRVSDLARPGSPSGRFPTPRGSILPQLRVPRLCNREQFATTTITTT